MYCKYCGKRIDASTIKCPACGASINPADGGQSFFDSNELAAWQAEQEISSASKTIMPKTRLYDAEKLRKTPVYKSQPPLSEAASCKEKKERVQIFDADFASLLSSAKKLIIAAAAVLLAIVLVVGAFYVRGLKKKMESIENSISNQRNADEKNIAAEKPENNNRVAGEKEEIKGEEQEKTDERKPEASAMPGEYPTPKFVLKIDGKEISHPQPLYTIDGEAFVQIESVLKGMGYGQKNVIKEGKNWVFDLKEDNGETRVEIELDTKNMWIKEKGEPEEPFTLESSNIEKPEGRYVPAASFFNNLGYNVDCPNENKDNPVLTVTKRNS